ncbi:MAG: cistern family PEP-CTERM protein [Kastovskya adunca ATA6-11-RM4]|jgi:hypothetical protein|nr:cistern family PEP-CTERM protein [Kastovskya adunca ATA6-11-RM4]
MTKTFSKVALGLSVLSTVAMGSLVIAPSASAFIFSGGTVEVGLGDIGQNFTVDFGGNVNENNVTGLSSSAIFKFLGFTLIGTGNTAKTEAAFEITLDNTSSNGINSRTSALGFDVDLPLLGVGSQSGSGNTRSSGIFTNDRSGSFPNQFGAVDVCFTNGNTCQGGSNGGVKTADAPGKFTATLAYSGDVKKLALSNFGVRYQSIDGNGFNGASGTGVGTPKPPKKPRDPQDIPEPGTVASLLLFGLGGLRLSKGKKDKQEHQVGA